MNARDKVLACFPRSEVRKEPAIFRQDADDLLNGGDWVIFTGPEFDAEELGRGRNETEAWADAAGLQGNQAA
jgi:hypothetical protein